MRAPWHPRTINRVTVTTSLTDAEAGRLAELAAGRMVLEIGAGYGYSGILMANTARHVTTIDPFKARSPMSFEALRGETAYDINITCENYRRAGVAGKITVIEARSEDVLPRLVDTHARYGLVFIDGDHTLRAVTSDLHYAVLLREPGGVIAVHDYDEDTCPDVATAIAATFTGGLLTDSLWEWGPDDGKGNDDD